MPKLEPYRKTLDYSYCLGVFPALKLLEARPECATRLLLSPEGERNEGVSKLRARCAELVLLSLIGVSEGGSSNLEQPISRTAIAKTSRFFFIGLRFRLK